MNKRFSNEFRAMQQEEAGGDADGSSGGAGGSILSGAKSGAAALAGGAPTPWTAALPEDIRNDPSFATVKAKDANEALGIIAKMHLNAQKLIGTARLQKPQDNWTADQWKTFHKELGVPETPDKYGTPKFEFAKGLALDEKKIAGWKAKMHALGFTPRQAEGLMSDYFAEINTEFTSQESGRTQQRTQAEAELRQEFGDSYDASVDIAKGVLMKFGDESLVAALEQTGAANNPAMVKFLVKLGKTLGEDKALGSGGGELGGAGAALIELNALKTDTEFQKVLLNRKAPGHAQAVEKWTALHVATANKGQRRE